MGDLVSVLLRVKNADIWAQVGTNSQISIPKYMAFKAYYWFQKELQVYSKAEL